MSAARIDVLERLRDLAHALSQGQIQPTAVAINRAADMLERELARVDQRETMRDRFAMSALTGLLAWPGDDAGGNHQNNNTPAGVADLAYEYADAMMKRRTET